MKNRLIKRANIEVSEIGFGCMSLGDDKKLNERLIHKAIEHGVTYLDTADLYQFGENERMVGEAIKGRRDQVFLATKVGNRWGEHKEGWEWTPKKSYILSAVEDSLMRLGVEQIDLYQLHGGTINDPFDEVIEAFEQLKGQGKIKAYGLSSIRPNVFLKLAKESNVATNMMQYSLLDRRPEEYFDELKKAEVGVIVRGALAKGLLAGKKSSNYLNYKSESVDLMRDKVKSFSIEKINAIHVALAWVLSHDAVSSAVVGIRTMEQLDELISFKENRSRFPQNLDALSSVLEPNQYLDHRE